jgi:hypothetical protein
VSKILRIQLLSDREGIDALTQAAAADSVTTETSEVQTSDQRFGVVELAAIIAIVHGTAQIAELLVKAFNSLKSDKTITVKTPKGSLTLEGGPSTSVEKLLEQIEASGIL